VLDEIEAKIKQLDLENIRLAIQSTQLGSSEPWPPSDFEGTAQELWTAVEQAQPISIADLTKGLERVAVRLSRTTSLVPVLGGDKGWLEVIVPAIYGEGLIADPRADVEMRYLIQLGGGTVTTTRGGQPAGQYGAYSLRTEVSLALPARILRGASIHHADVELGHITAITALPEVPSPPFLKQHLEAVTGQLLAKVRADTRKPVGTNPWIAQASNGEELETWAKKFRASYTDRRANLDAGLFELGGFSEVQAKATYAGNIPKMDDILQKGALNARWTHFLGEAGIPFGIQGTPSLRHDWILSRHTNGGPLQGAIACASRTALQDNECLAMLDGRYLRYSGASWVDRSQTKMVLKGNEYEGLWQNLNQTMRNVIVRTQTGQSGALLAPHKDTAAIFDALQRVKRTNVPDTVTRQLANRIARILDGETVIPDRIRNNWVMQVDGKPWYNLAAVGEARRAGLIPANVQEAVRRAINRVQYEDPIALFGFDQPFLHSRDGDYVILPEEYSQRFAYPRPSGAGSLYSEQVLDGWGAVTKLARYYSDDRRAALAKIQEHRPQLAASQALMVSYHDPSAGPDAAGSIYFFWYRKAPKGWKQLLPTLPKGQGLHRIGPACELAPDYIGEAKQLLRLYQEDLAR